MVFWYRCSVQFNSKNVNHPTRENFVDDLLQLRKNKLFLFLFCLHAFAYVFDLGLPSEFGVDNET